MFNLITTIIAKSGVVGVFLLMLLENILPIIPSELILPLAGYQAADGQFDPVVVIIAATIGSVIGGCFWYGLGRWFGLHRLQAIANTHGRWLPITRSEVAKADAWFKRWGALAVCVGRTLPGVRGVICIPAGIGRMPLLKFLVWSTLGAFAWSDLLVSCGYILHTHYDLVEKWLNPVADGFLVLCAAAYLFRVIRYRPDRV